MSFPILSSLAVGQLVRWMLILTVKHVIADFILQNSWMALGKDQKTGWAQPLLVHCAVHGALTTVLTLIIAPRFWFIGLVDVAVHITVDRTKSICASGFNVTREHQWFWWLLGIDQALHNLTGFFLSIYIAANT